MSQPMAATPRDRRRPRRRWILLAVVGLIAVWLVVVAVQLYRANRSLHHGVDAVATARSRLASEDIAAGRSLPPLRAAHAAFANAHAAVSGPLMAPLRIVPMAGRQLRSVQALSSAAARVTTIGTSAFQQFQTTLQSPHSSGVDRVAVLHHVATTASATERELAKVSLGPDHALIGPLASRRNQFQAELDKLRISLGRGGAAADGIADLLGGPRTYLLLVANNAEMRSGSGMFLSAGTIHTEDGRITMGQIEKTSDITLARGVPATGDMDARWGWLHPGSEWRNLNMTPAFDQSAALASKMWVALGRPPVDGVMSLDVGALQQVLAATGPVPGPNGPIGADNVEQFLLHDQYLVGDPFSPTRVDMLGAVGSAALQAATAPSVDLFKLGTGLAKAALSRRVLLWSADPRIQTDWVTAGVAGVLRPETLLVSVLNRGGNKLDRFLDVKNDLSVRPVGDSSEMTVRVTLTNRTPPGEPQYIAGPNETLQGPPGRYIGLLAANVPGTAGRLGIDDLTDYAAAGRDGPTLVAAVPVTIDAGQSKEYTIHFQLAGRHGKVVVTPSARIPSVQWHSQQANFTDESAQSFQW